MPIVYEKLLALKIPDVEHTYGPKDCMLYALGVGLGLDPIDEEQLAFVYEKHLKLLPSMAVVLAHPGFWAKDLDTGIDWVKVVAGEHSVVLHRPLKPAGTVLGHTKILDIVDKGAGKGAISAWKRLVRGSIRSTAPANRCWRRKLPFAIQTAPSPTLSATA